MDNFLAMTALAVVTGVIGYLIGKSKGIEGLGLALGLFLGIFGILIICILNGKRKQCPYCRSQVPRDATVCSKCQRNI